MVSVLQMSVSFGAAVSSLPPRKSEDRGGGILSSRLRGGSEDGRTFVFVQEQQRCFYCYTFSAMTICVFMAICVVRKEVVHIVLVFREGFWNGSLALRAFFFHRFQPQFVIGEILVDHKFRLEAMEHFFSNVIAAVFA